MTDAKWTLSLSGQPHRRLHQPTQSINLFISVMLTQIGGIMQIERLDSGNMYQYILWDENGSRVIGGATILPQAERLVHLKNINVAGERRGEGLGNMLLERILMDFQGFEITAEVFEGRVAWYERHGFKRVSKHGTLVKLQKPP